MRQRAFTKPQQHTHENHKLSVAFLLGKDFQSSNSLLKSDEGKYRTALVLSRSPVVFPQPSSRLAKDNECLSQLSRNVWFV